MKNHQSYQSLVDLYSAATRLVKRLLVSAVCIQTCIFLVISGWKHLEIEYYNLAAPILFSISALFAIKDFLPYRGIDLNMTEIILKGLALEKKSRSSENFFHDVIKNYKVARTVLQRSAVNLGVLWIFGNLLYQHVLELNPDFKAHYEVLNLWIGIVSICLIGVYYMPFKDLVDEKRKAFPKKPHRQEGIGK